MNTLFNFLKLAALLIYLATALSFVLEPLQAYSFILSVVTLILLVTHITEFILMKGKLDAFQEQDGQHFIKTLLFGFLHWLPLLMAQNKQTAD
ncbi:MAG: hypothetical protein AseanaTS_14540 [Candidatus Pelagadaptatus aseana]|uniref:hypothetical protein n=1 Tax=Candidatus Pelagadaptatus aseana TaxID=3120508 RepID=UPI0039B18AAF